TNRPRAHSNADAQASCLLILKRIDLSVGRQGASLTMTDQVISAVLPSMADAEQYLSCDSLTARSTAAAGRLRPLTGTAKWMRVNTLGSVSARSLVSVTSQPSTS